MKRRFKGEWVHKMDAKGRVSIPALFRRVLEEHDPDWTEGETPNLVITHGLSDQPRLECYTMASAEALDRMVETFKPFSDERYDMEALIEASSNYVQLDDTGRVVLSQRLRDAAGLTDEAMLVGMGERFHIWAPAAYETYNAGAAARRRAALALLDPASLRGSGG